MSRASNLAARARVRLGVGAVLAIGLVSYGTAQGATVAQSGFSATATATVAPTRLPTKGTAPITLTIRATGTRPESPTNPVPNPQYPLHAVGVRLDRQITVDTAGLPTCSTSDLKGVTPTGARRKCGDALIGSGSEEITALVAAGEPATFNATWDLLFFNAWTNGHPAVLMYRSYTRIPQGIAWPIGTGRNLRIEDVGGKENRTLADSFHIRIGTTWRYKGERHSYLNGQCRTGKLKNPITLELDSGKVSETVPQRCTRRRAR